MRNFHAAVIAYFCFAGFGIVDESIAADGRSIPKPSPATIQVNWDAIIEGSSTELTIQVCPEPPMRRGGAIHRQAHDALRDLKMRYARLQPWYPYPKLSMAALKPPSGGRTYWDFSLIDPIVLDFYQAAEGRPIVLNMAIPGWLFKGPVPSYPENPDEIDWKYELGPHISKELRDPTFQEVADYFRRVAEWYIKGSFTDEYGRQHQSGHQLKIDYWEVLNEQEEGTGEEIGQGHELSPEAYTALYDEVVSKLRIVDPNMKFSGLALGYADYLHYFEYFLNPRNHKTGIPIDMAETGRTLSEWQREMYADADRFLRTAKIIERIKDRLSPRTKTFISEFGVMYGPEIENTAGPRSGKAVNNAPNIPPEYWQLAASIFAHVFVGASSAGVDLMAAAELVNYPGMFAGTNLIHWETGAPNAVYAAVKLIHEQIPVGSPMYETKTDLEGVTAQAFNTSVGRKLLLINRAIIPTQVNIKDATGGMAYSVDARLEGSHVLKKALSTDAVTLNANAVTIISWDSP
jgi:hypothetical protein